MCPNFVLEVDPDPEIDPNSCANSDSAWIRIHAIPIPALFDAKKMES